MSEKNVVSKDFRDKLTNDFHPIGSEYVSDDPKRIEELKELGYLNEGQVSEEDLGDPNDVQWPKHTGGGHYELSNGEKVKGKDKAIVAEEELTKRDE